MYYKKVYVEMIAKINPEGKIKPLEVEWQDGRRYKIERVLDERLAPPDNTGGYLTKKYKVLIGGREKALFFETKSGRWFVETIK